MYNHIAHAVLSEQSLFDSSNTNHLYFHARRLFFESYGDVNASMNRLISHIRPPRATLTNNRLISELKNIGYVQYKCNKGLEDDLRTILMRSLDSAYTDKQGIQRYGDFISLLKDPSIKKLLFESEFKLIADSYLGCDSILNSIQFWGTPGTISRTYSDLDKQAMLFHRDADHNMFLKIFIYLSDVTSQCGPHQYVPNTHTPTSMKSCPLLAKDTRINPIQIINENLLISDCIGEFGSIIIGDTHSLHRGTPPRNGKIRYVLQLQFVDSLLGPETQAANPLNLEYYPYK